MSGSRALGTSASAPSLGGQRDDDVEDELPPSVSTRPGRKGATYGSRALAASTPSTGLYGVPSYSSLYVDPEDLEPGPGTYDTHPGIGSQLLSTRESAPANSLTAKHDKAWSKVMITKDHLNVLKARNTPGPGTYEPDAVASQRRIRMGTSKRQPLHDPSFKAPGPVYEVRTQPDNPREHIKFSKGSRFEKTSLTDALGSTGPGQYEVDTLFDGIRLSKSFGASHRAYDKVRFPGSERQNVGLASPGPGPYKAYMNDSSKISFGRAERLPDNNAAKRAPGPGEYPVHSIERNRNPTSRAQSVYSFGRPHPRGRMDWKQMRHMGNSVWGLQ